MYNQQGDEIPHRVNHVEMPAKADNDKIPNGKQKRIHSNTDSPYNNARVLRQEGGRWKGRQRPSE